MLVVVAAEVLMRCSQPGAGTVGSGGVGGGGEGSRLIVTSGEPQKPATVDATQSTGGGGGGGGGGSYRSESGQGGSGIVIVRYQIGSTNTAKATGGAISFYNNKTIHVFTSSGTFINPSSISNAEIVMVAGGGSGGTNIGGGGGAGGVLEGSSLTLPATTYAITVGGGGSGSTQAPGPGASGALATPGANTTISYPGPYTWTANGGGEGGGIQVMSAHNQVDLVVVVAQIPHQEYQMVVVQLKVHQQTLGTLTGYGNAGGPGYSAASGSGNYQSAGGGGAGQAGVAGASNSAGAGGYEDNYQQHLEIPQ